VTAVLEHEGKAVVFVHADGDTFVRRDVDRLRQLKIDDPLGRQIPILQLADIVIEDGPSEISRQTPSGPSRTR
jgi:cobalt-zinc-cadmium resistance protein CzcA